MEDVLYAFKRVCNYYETDKMGVIYHGNYIHYLEEARISFLNSIGYPFNKLEELDVFSPVIGINVEYKSFCRFADEIEVRIKVSNYSGVRFSFVYEIFNLTTNKVALVGESKHCFTNKDGRIISLKKACLELHNVFEGFVYEKD